MNKKERVGVIYRHLNLINGKSYIGQTINKPEYRWGKNGEGYKDSPKFWGAIQKYGWNSFEHIILESNIPQNKLNEREEYWINYYHSDLDEYGYNLTSGGYLPLSKDQLNNRMEKFKKWQKEHPDQVQKAITKMQQYWKDHPEEKKQVLKRATNASIEYWKNNPEKMQKNLANMREKAKEKTTKPVKCIETNIIYESAREASRQTGIIYTSIGKVCNNRQQTAGGYHWCFVDKKEYEKCKK